MRKQPLTIYLEPTMFNDLAAYASRRNHAKSLVAEAAITSFLSPEAAGRQEAAIAKRLDRIVRVLERLERNDTIAIETLALFIRLLPSSLPDIRLSNVSMISVTAECRASRKSSRAPSTPGPQSMLSSPPRRGSGRRSDHARHFFHPIAAQLGPTNCR